MGLRPCIIKIEKLEGNKQANVQVSMGDITKSQLYDVLESLQSRTVKQLVDEYRQVNNIPDVVPVDMSDIESYLNFLRQNNL